MQIGELHPLSKRRANALSVWREELSSFPLRPMTAFLILDDLLDLGVMFVAPSDKTRSVSVICLVSAAVHSAYSNVIITIGTYDIDVFLRI